MNLVEFDTERASRYLQGALCGFLIDPADSDYQRGFLAALLVVYQEGIGRGKGDDRLKALHEQTRAV